MYCSNPDCRQEARDLSSGTLRLLEMEVPPEERITGADYGFPVVAVPTKHFWLCAVCARLFRMRRWTLAGVILEPLLPQAVEEAGAAKFAPGHAIAPRRAAGFRPKLAFENVV